MIRPIVALIAVAGIASDAMAYHEISSFQVSANIGGAGGMYATGSSRFRGYTCDLCHTGGEGRISATVTSDPAELLGSGVYTPGQTYAIRVELVGEHRGLDSAFNPNTFAADILDRGGASAGAFGTIDSIVEIADGGRIAVAEGFGNGETSWTFAWSAPNDSGPLELHLALLDGDGASDPVTRFIDPFNDDVATFAATLCPSGGACPDPESTAEIESPTAGCQTGSGRGAAALVFVALLALVRRRG